jgi:hypothetical protein
MQGDDDRVTYGPQQDGSEVRPVFRWANLRVWLVTVVAVTVVPLMFVAAHLAQK